MPGSAVGSAAAPSAADTASEPSPSVLLHDDKKKALSRVEFFACLVHIAVNKYVKTKKMPDVSEALRRLLQHDIEPKLDPRCLSRANPFRRDHCYKRDVCAVLEEYEPSLRCIFVGVSRAYEKAGTEAKMVSLDEWKGFVRGLDLIGPDLSDRDANLCFSWSRMCTVDIYSDKGRVRELQLPFEGFLEALVRVSVLKALPTAEEIERSGCDDADAYLDQLKANDEEAYQALLRDRATPWGEEPTTPTFECVSQLCSIIVRRIEMDSEGADNMELTSREVDNWIARRMKL